MAATHKKITIDESRSAAAEVAYLANPQATGDYYSESEHAFMRWVASDRARTVLGLDDRVALWKLERLLNGQHPVTGKSLPALGAKRDHDRRSRRHHLAGAQVRLHPLGAG